MLCCLCVGLVAVLTVFAVLPVCGAGCCAACVGLVAVLPVGDWLLCYLCLLCCL